MFKYALKRILLAFVTTAIILTLTYFLMKIQPYPQIPGKTDVQLVYWGKQVHLGYVLEFTEPQSNLGKLLWFGTDSKNGVTYYYYQRPIYQQFFQWVANIFTKGEWGTSTRISQNVDAMVLIRSRIGTTIKINVWSVIISVPAGIALGIWAALKKNTMTDHIISTLVMVFISVPSFIIISLLMSWLGYSTGLLPTQWPVSDTATLSQKIRGYIIPVMALSFGSICGYCRFTRAELTEIMSSDFLLLARTKGLSKSQTLTRHALKNAMVPILPSILSEVIGLLGGSMILESLYGIPGVGKLYITSLNLRDYHVLMADMSFYTIIGLVAGVFLDLSYGFIDPRIRMGAKK